MSTESSMDLRVTADIWDPSIKCSCRLVAQGLICQGLKSSHLDLLCLGLSKQFCFDFKVSEKLGNFTGSSSKTAC